MATSQPKTETKSAEFITFRGALYRKTVGALPWDVTMPRQPEPSRIRRPHTPAPQVDPSEVQKRSALKQEITNDIDSLIRHLAEAPVGPSELRGKFDQFSKGVSVLTDKIEQPLNEGLKGLAVTFRKLLKARDAIEKLQF